MKYTFLFTSSSGDENTYVCEAKTLNDAVSQLAIFIYNNDLTVSSFSYYYYVDGKRGRNQRIFSHILMNRFWNFYRIVSLMGEHYGIDK